MNEDDRRALSEYRGRTALKLREIAAVGRREDGMTALNAMSAGSRGRLLRAMAIYAPLLWDRSQSKPGWLATLAPEVRAAFFLTLEHAAAVMEDEVPGLDDLLADLGEVYTLDGPMVLAAVLAQGRVINERVF